MDDERISSTLAALFVVAVSRRVFPRLEKVPFGIPRDQELSADQMALSAESLGLAATCKVLDWPVLISAKGVFPLIARSDRGEAVVRLRLQRRSFRGRYSPTFGAWGKHRCRSSRGFQGMVER